MSDPAEDTVSPSMKSPVAEWAASETQRLMTYYSLNDGDELYRTLLKLSHDRLSWENVARDNSSARRAEQLENRYEIKRLRFHLQRIAYRDYGAPACHDIARKALAGLADGDVLCPHGFPLWDNICGPCSKGKPNRGTQRTT